MREIVVVVLAALLLAGLGYGIQSVAQPDVYQSAWLWMIGICTAAVVAEVIYFSTLFFALKTLQEMPRRWYARSFEHHKLLSPLQRYLILPWFFVGALGLLVALTIALLLTFASFGIYRSL